MAFNPKELNRVQTANTRSGGVDYDLAYSEDTSKFRVSPGFYEEMDMANHGLTLLEDSGENRLVLAAEPNEVAVMHRGREGYNKGREFTASRLRIKLDEYGFKGVEKFELKHIETIDDIKYYEITSEEKGETLKDGDPVPVDHVPGEESQSFGDVGSAEQQPAQDDTPQDDAENQQQEPDHDDLDNLLN